MTCGAGLFRKSPAGKAGPNDIWEDLAFNEGRDEGMLVSSTLLGAMEADGCSEEGFFEDSDLKPENLERCGAIAAAAGFWGAPSASLGWK